MGKRFTDSQVSGNRIAIISMNYPPEASGIAPYSGALAEGLCDVGYQVAAFAAHPHYPEWRIHDGFGQWKSRERINGVEVQRRRHYVPRPPRGIKRLVSEITFGIRLVLTGWGRPAVVIAVSPSLFATALVALRVRLSLHRPAFIVWMQDVYTLGLAETGEGSATARRLTRWVEAWTVKSADRVVVIHERFADFISRELRAPGSRIAVVRNWTHLKSSEPVDAAAAREALGWPTKRTLAVHTGNMGVKQGLENVIDAARLADQLGVPVHFILVGDGGERRGLEERAKGISRLTFVEPLDDTRYRLALGAADVLVVNEKPGVYGMAVPSKLTSYFDAGRPVVAATDPGGITAAEIAAAHAGVVVKAGDPEALLDAITDMTSDAEAAIRYSANARRYRFEVLGQQAALQQWESVVKSCLARPHRV